MHTILSCQTVSVVIKFKDEAPVTVVGSNKTMLQESSKANKKCRVKSSKMIEEVAVPKSGSSKEPSRSDSAKTSHMEVEPKLVSKRKSEVDDAALLVFDDNDIFACPSTLLKKIPSYIKVDDLCKHCMIAQWEYYKVKMAYYRCAAGILGPKKAYYQSMPRIGFNFPKEGTDHNYAFVDLSKESKDK